MLLLGVTNNFEYIPDGSDSKECACNARDPGSISGLGRSPGEGNGNSLQCSCLENGSLVGCSPWGSQNSRAEVSD